MVDKGTERDIVYEYSMLMYECYSKLWDLCCELPQVLDIDGNSPLKAELTRARDELLDLHRISMDYVNTDLL